MTNVFFFFFFLLFSIGLSLLLPCVASQRSHLDTCNPVTLTKASCLFCLFYFRDVADKAASTKVEEGQTPSDDTTIKTEKKNENQGLDKAE